MCGEKEKKTPGELSKCDVFYYSVFMWLGDCGCRTIVIVFFPDIIILINTYNQSTISVQNYFYL